MPQSLNPNRPNTEEALTAHLAATIGADVENAMTAADWKYTENTPQAPVNPESVAPTTSPEGQKASDNPNAQPTASNDAINWEAYRDSNGLILGKYKNSEAAVQGMHSLLQMTKSVLNERDALQAEIGQLRQQRSTPVAEQVSSIPHVDSNLQLPELDAVRKKLEAGEGLDADDALKLVDGMAKYSEIAAQKVLERDRNMRQQETDSWKNVDTYMSQHYPQSLKHADEMEVFVRTNQEVGRVFNRLLAGNDDGAKLDATIYLWKEYSSANPVTPIDPAQQEAQLAAQAQVRKEEVDRARIDAGLFGNSAGGIHESSQNTGVTQADIDAAARQMKQTADGRQWRELTIGRTLTGPFFEN
jgi:hypothetical protein